MFLKIESTPWRGTNSTCRVGEHCCTGILPTASVWLRVLHPVWTFALLPISPPMISVLLVSRSTFLYFLHFPGLSILSCTSSLKILLSMPFQVPPKAYFLSSCISLILPWLVDFTSIVSVVCFSFPSILLRFS